MPPSFLASAPWLRFQCDERIGHAQANYDFTLTAPWTAIFGPSGSGKTTLLRLLAGLLPQHSGTCLLHSRELRSLPAHRRRIALVDQAASVFPHLTVQQNVAFASRKTLTAEADLPRLLAQCHLTHIANASGATISGGEAQRVVLARALYSQPDLLLLDESFSGLDRELRTHLRSVLVNTQQTRAQQGRPMPIVSVTHDVGEVFATAAEVLRMHQGSLVQQGSPAEILHVERLAVRNDLAGND